MKVLLQSTGSVRFVFFLYQFKELYQHYKILKDITVKQGFKRFRAVYQR